MEKILEHQFLFSQFQRLRSMEQSHLIELQRKPNDIQLTARLDRIQHDMKLLAPMIQELEDGLLREAEKKSGGTFKILLQKEPFKEQISKLVKA